MLTDQLELVSSKWTYLAAAVLIALAPQLVSAQAPAEHETTTVPALEVLVDPGPSELQQVVERYSADRAALLRRYDAVYSPERQQRLRTFYQNWQDELASIDFDALGVEGRIDYVLLDNTVQYELHEVDRQARLFDEMAHYLPFALTVTDLFTGWRDDPDIEPREAADILNQLGLTVQETQEELATAGEEVSQEERLAAYRAVNATRHLADLLEEWYSFYDGYDPLFTWWNEQPHERAQDVLGDYAGFLEREVVGITDEEDDPIIGDPIGAEAMHADLRHEMIPYSPEELIEIAWEEFAWGEERMRQAAREMGHGDDWQAAMEEVKTRHVEPGEQPNLVKELSDEAVAFLQEHDLVTVPPLADEVWRMTMLSPEWQEFAPFFLGGEVVRIAYPAHEMPHENKLMSIRGNNRHFSRAVVHHELIPGHHLQGFMTSRYNSHRSAFRTPFWGEGWALYWEMLLWDQDFAQTPEDRIGMLFWRNHRAARIIFSLGFHLGEMTPEDAIDFLVERVGHERANAEAEVRRSFAGDYPPLYQAAYMLGGLQFRALHDELVQQGEWTNREFHDSILQGGRKPVEMVRVRLMEELIPRDYEAQWRFYE